MTMRFAPLILICLFTGACGSSKESAPPQTPDAAAPKSDAAAPQSDSGVSQADAAAMSDRPAAMADAPAPVPFARPLEFIHGTRLQGLFLQSADGARERWEMYDNQLQTRCGLNRADDGKLRCLPFAPSSFDLNILETAYADSDCTEMALPEEATCAAGFGFKDGAMGRSVYRLGPVRALTMVYRRTTTVTNGITQNGCMAAPGTPTKKYFSLGMLVPAASFVEAQGTRSDGPTTQRLRALYWQMTDGARVRVNQYFSDGDLMELCQARTTSDGSLRCLPSSGATVSAGTFADDKCTAPATFITGAPTATAPKYAVSVTDAAGGCQPTYRVFLVGAPLAPSLGFRMTAGQCIPVPAGSSANTYFATGEELPPSKFASLHRTSLVQ